MKEVDIATRKNWHVSGGVKVVSVSPGGPADLAGVRKGDVITQLGFESIVDLKSYEEIEAALPSNTLLPIRFFNKGNATYRTFILKD